MYIIRTYYIYNQNMNENLEEEKKFFLFFPLTNKTEVVDGFINSKEIYIQIRKT